LMNVFSRRVMECFALVQCDVGALHLFLFFRNDFFFYYCPASGSLVRVHRLVGHVSFGIIFFGRRGWYSVF